MRDVALISADVTTAVDASNNDTVSTERLVNECWVNKRWVNERMNNERMGNPSSAMICWMREPKCVRVASVAGLARVCVAFTASHALPA
jgi:hypothetical protein